MNPTAATTDILDLAARHVATAAQLLEANDTSEQLFSPARSLAAQLILIGNGISPRITTGTPTGTPTSGETVTGNLDLALAQLKSISHHDGRPDHLIWAQRLMELRPRVAAAASLLP